RRGQAAIRIIGSMARGAMRFLLQLSGVRPARVIGTPLAAPAALVNSLRATATSRRLNWGCGPRGVDGWINADRVPGPASAIVRDIRDGLPLRDRSIDYAVAIHGLQDLSYLDVAPALAELRRILKPGAVLRLALPDLDRAMRAHLGNDRGYFYIPDEHATSI